MTQTNLSNTRMSTSRRTAFFRTTSPSTGASQRGSVTATLASHLATIMFSSAPADRAVWRSRIVTLIENAHEPAVCIDEFLKTCISQGGSDGLDTAVDVLCKTKDLIVEYAWSYLKCDVRNWEPSTERAYKPNDDYWYILLRSVARASTVGEDERLRLICACAQATSRGIREGVVDALSDLGTSRSRESIRRLAENDLDAFIRKIAREALEEMES